MSYYSELSRSSSNLSTPSSQSFSSNVRKRDSWCDQYLKQSILAEISEVDEFSSPQQSRYSASRGRSSHIYQCEDEATQYFLPHIKSYLKFDVSIPIKAIPISLFSLEKKPIEKISPYSENIKKPDQSPNTPKFNLNPIDKEKCNFTNCSNAIVENKIDYSFSKSQLKENLAYGTSTKSIKLIENSNLSSIILLPRIKKQDHVNSISINEKKKLDFGEIDINMKNPETQETNNNESTIEPINWNFPSIKSHEKLLKSCLEVKNPAPPTEQNKIIEEQRKKLDSISNFYNEFLDDLQEVKNLITNFNKDSKSMIKLQKAEESQTKIWAKQVKTFKLSALKMKASEIPKEMRWIRHKVLSENEQKVEIWNHVASRSSQYSGKLVYKKFLNNGKTELIVYKGFSDDRSEKIWEKFSGYIMNIASSNEESETLFNVSKYWLLFLKFERRITKIAHFFDEFVVRVDSFNVYLSGLLLSLPWQISFNFSRLSEKYNLADMILECFTN